MCGDDIDIIDGRPTGSVRISFGYMSTFEDAQNFLKFIIATQLSKADMKFPFQPTPTKTVTESEESPMQNDQTSCHNADVLSMKTIIADSGPWNNSSAMLKTTRWQPPETELERTRAAVSEQAVPVHSSSNKPIIVTNICLYPIKSCSAFEVRI